MAFLDNSGNIILDAVLTDTGRLRLAQGKFKITKFALGDDEINYGIYNKSHPSGSAYYDLEILQTPILEAFTNNAASMKSTLISIPRTNLLYLPVMKVNNNFDGATDMHSDGAYLVAVDQDTENSFATVQGVVMGATLNGGEYVRVDQGLDTSEIPPTFVIDADLVETQYIIEIDNRLGKIVSRFANKNRTTARVSYIDDDNIASYYLSLGTDPEFVSENSDTTSGGKQVISGPRGTYLEFSLQASLDLTSSTYLFELLGGTATVDGVNVYYIDSIVRVAGASTGTSIDIPVRFIRNV